MKANFIVQYGGSEVDEIPIIGSVRVGADVTNLYAGWSPALRYKCITNLDYRTVKSFIEVASNIRSAILNFVTP